MSAEPVVTNNHQQFVADVSGTDLARHLSPLISLVDQPTAIGSSQQDCPWSWASQAPSDTEPRHRMARHRTSMTPCRLPPFLVCLQLLASSFCCAARAPDTAAASAPAALLPHELGACYRITCRESWIDPFPSVAVCMQTPVMHTWQVLHQSHSWLKCRA